MRLLAGTPFDRPPHCERCEKPESECVCPPVPVKSSLKPPSTQTVRLSVEKRKKGKIITLIRGLAASENDLPQLLTQLKNLCGAGGTIIDDELEIQGEHIERIRKKLAELGYQTKS